MVLPWFYQHSPRWYKCISPYFITNQKLLDAKRSYATVPHLAGATPARNWNSCSPWRKSQKVAATLQWMGKTLGNLLRKPWFLYVFVVFTKALGPKRLASLVIVKPWPHISPYLKVIIDQTVQRRDLDALPCHQFDCWMGSTWCSLFNHFAKKNFENFHIVNIVQNCASSFLLLLKHPTAFAPQ